MIVTRTQSKFVGPKHPWYEGVDYACFWSSKLYHVGLHYMLEIWNYNQDNWNQPGFQRKKIPSLDALDKHLKTTMEYGKLHSKVAQATIKLLHDDFMSFVAGYFDFWKWVKYPILKKKFPRKYKACPQPPGFKGDRYISRTDSRKPAKFTYQAMSGGQIVDSDKKQIKGARLTESVAPKGIITLCPRHPILKQEIPFTVHQQPQVVTIQKGKNKGKTKIKTDSDGKTINRVIGICEVRYIPVMGGYNVETVYEEELTVEWTKKQQQFQRIAGIDLGVNILAAMVIEGVFKPHLFNGNILKALMYWSYWNIEVLKSELYWCKKPAERKVIDSKKKAAHNLKWEQKKLKSILNPEEQPTDYLVQGLVVQAMFAANYALQPEVPEYDPELSQTKTSKIPQNSSKRIQNAYRKLKNRTEHYLHVVSSMLVKLLVENGVVTLVVGRNKDWKQFKRGMKGFARIPFNRFVEMLTYKCEAVGIEVHLQDEAYTSQAAAKLGDSMPRKYLGPKKKKPTFSGERVHRGLYINNDGTRVHADVNAPVNIVVKFRKANKLPKIDLDWAEKVLTAPFKIQTQKDVRLVRSPWTSGSTAS